MKKITTSGFTFFIVDLTRSNFNFKLFRMFPLLHQYYVLEIFAYNKYSGKSNISTNIVKSYLVGYDIFGTFIPITSTNNTTVTNINVLVLVGSNYTVRLVDSASYYITNQMKRTLVQFTILRLLI